MLSILFDPMTSLKKSLGKSQGRFMVGTRSSESMDSRSLASIMGGAGEGVTPLLLSEGVISTSSMAARKSSGVVGGCWEVV